MLTPRSSAFSSCSSVRCSDWTSITGSPLGIAAFPAQRDRAPGTRRMSTGEPSSKAPEYPGDLAENRDVRCVDRLERVVLRLQPHALVLAEEARHRRLVRRFVVSDERDHDLAVPSVLLLTDDDDVAVEDAGIDHRVALDAQQELLATSGERLGHTQVVLDVLLREQRPAGGDLADERQRMQLAVGPELNRLGGGAAVLQQLERAWLGRIAAKVARAFQIREVRMDGRRRGEADLLPDLAHGRRVAVPVDVLDEKVPDLLLSAGQHASLLGRLTNIRSRAE